MFSNSPTVKNFHCFQRKGSLESCGIKGAHFNRMLVVRGWGSLRNAKRVWSQPAEQTLITNEQMNKSSKCSMGAYDKIRFKAFDIKVNNE